MPHDEPLIVQLAVGQEASAKDSGTVMAYLQQAGATRLTPREAFALLGQGKSGFENLAWTEPVDIVAFRFGAGGNRRLVATFVDLLLAHNQSVAGYRLEYGEGSALCTREGLLDGAKPRVAPRYL